MTWQIADDRLLGYLMENASEQLQFARFQQLTRAKRVQPPATPSLGGEMVTFFKQSVEKRNAKFSKIADCWARLVPQTLADHCALESFVRGSLTVMVDSSSHLYELKQLLLAGLQQQLLLACAAVGLRKITLRPGRWYEPGDGKTTGRPRF